jgi:hypothetical protein
VDLSGIIFVVLALSWAVYLIPKALKQHDEVARTRSIDRFSSATRVLARREPVNRRDARLVVRPAPAVPGAPAAAPTAASAGRVTAGPTAGPTTTVTLTVEPAVSRGRLAARRTAAKRAARRRRRILTFLLACDAAAAVALYLGHASLPVVAVPVVLTLVYLVLCRTQVRHEIVRDRAVLMEPAPVGAEPEAVQSAPEPAVEVEVVPHTDEHGVADFDESEDTVGIPVEALKAALAEGRDLADDQGTLWDPLPVTLPTYVTKPKAKRTVRTIDLSEPRTWTSGRTAEDAEIVARAAEEATERATEAGSGEGGQRAVGG